MRCSADVNHAVGFAFREGEWNGDAPGFGAASRCQISWIDRGANLVHGEREELKACPAGADLFKKNGRQQS